jgi:hypothetical protein
MQHFSFSNFKTIVCVYALICILIEDLVFNLKIIQRFFFGEH